MTTSDTYFNPNSGRDGSSSAAAQPQLSAALLRQAMGPGYQVALFRESSAIGVQVRPTEVVASLRRPRIRRPQRPRRGFGLRFDWALGPVSAPTPCPTC